MYLFVYSEFVQIGTAHFSLDRVISGLQEANESPLWIGLTVTLRHLPTVKRDVFSELVQSNSGLASKQLQHNFFQRHLIVGWLFNNILKIRQNRFGERWEKLEIKIFNFHHRKPNFRKINSDKTSDNCKIKRDLPVSWSLIEILSSHQLHQGITWDCLAHGQHQYSQPKCEWEQCIVVLPQKRGISRNGWAY